MTASAGRPSRRSDDVLVVGGGVIGMAVAESLASEGLGVRVLEADSVGSGASGAAAGMLAPLSEATHEGPLLSLGFESLKRFPSLCARLREETGIDPELERSGLLRLASTAAEQAELQARWEFLKRFEASVDPEGPETEWLDGDSLRRDEPDLSETIRCALYSPLECHLRPPLLVKALESAARARGVVIESGIRATLLRHDRSRVVAVETSDGRREAGHIVVAAGPWSPELLEASNLSSSAAGRLGVEPVRGQILSLQAPLPPVQSIVWAGDAYLVPKRDGSLIVGATQEFVGFDRRVTAEGIRWLIERASAVYPALRDAGFERAWAGLRPVSRDGLPWIGRAPNVENLSLATGHGRNGVLLAPMTAELIRDDLMGKAAMPGAAELLPERGSRG